MLNKILGNSSTNGSGGGGIIGIHTRSDKWGGGRSATVSYDKSDRKFERVVWYPSILEAGNEKLSSFIGIGFVLNIVGSDRIRLFYGYHHLSIVEVLFPLNLLNYRDRTILTRGMASSLASDMFLKRNIYFKVNNLAFFFIIFCL